MPDRIRIGDVMQSNVLTAREDTTTMRALKRMAKRRAGSIVVVRGRRPIGIFTDHDLLYKVILPGKDPNEIPIGAVMTRDIVSVSPGSSVEAAHAKLQEGNFRHLLVTDHDDLVGIVSVKDLIRVRQKTLEVRVQQKTRKIRSVSDRLAESLRILEREMHYAGHFQKKLIAREHPRFDRLRFSHVYEQADALGGDYFEVIPINTKRMGVFVGDVMGHGITSAFIAGELKLHVNRLATECSGPSVFLRRLNSEMTQVMPEGFFVAGFYMELNPKTLKGSYTQFGLPRPGVFRVKTGQFEPLPPTDVPIGIQQSAVYPERPIAFANGDILLLFTDGCSEQKNPKTEQLGEQRFSHEFTRLARDSKPDIAASLFKKIKRFAGSRPISDDIAILIMECLPPPASLPRS